MLQEIGLKICAILHKKIAQFLCMLGNIVNEIGLNSAKKYYCTIIYE